MLEPLFVMSRDQHARNAARRRGPKWPRGEAGAATVFRHQRTSSREWLDVRRLAVTRRDAGDVDRAGCSLTRAAGLLDRLKNRTSAYPEVTQCYDVTESADFILVVNAGSIEEYGAFTERAFFADKNNKSLNTFVAMQTVKFTIRINLDAS